jgi:hypothetical protein
MRSVTWVRLLAICLGVWGVWSCGDDSAPPKKATHRDAGDEYACVDEDGDGYGTYCDKGADCDDTDPSITDACRRCTQPKLNCPCKPGTMPMKCDPPNIKVEGGTLVCSEGTRYCRDGVYSDCEIIGQYVLVPDK